MRSYLLLIAAALLCAPLWADMGPKPRTTAPGLQFHAGDVKDVSVEMTAEEVDLVLSRGDDQDTLSVTATFHMTNLGEAAAFEVGFPIGTHQNMTGFKVSTDGVEHEIKLIDRNPVKPDAKQDDEFMHAHAYWYVWDASYAANAKVTHVVTYQVDVWHFSEHRNTGYILASGAGWKNAIGKAVVTLKCAGEFTADNLRDVSPKRNFELKDGTFTWTFKDLEPTGADNIQISYNSQTTFAADVAQLRAEHDKYWDSRQELVYLLAGAHERQGREQMNAAELDDYVASLAELLSELKEEDGKFIMPGKTNEKIYYSDDIDPELKKMLESMMEDQDRSYVHEHGVQTFFNNFGALVKVVAANPEHAAAREALAKWQRLGQAFFDGTYYIDDAKFEMRKGGERTEVVKHLNQYIADSKKLLEAAKQD